MPRNRIEDEEKYKIVPSLTGLWSSQETAREVEWHTRLRDLDDVALLKADWDGDGAEVPSRALLKSARALLMHLRTQNELPPTRIVPTLDGTILIEWQDQQEYRECEVSSPSLIEWFVQYPGGESAAWEENLLAPSESWVDDDWLPENVGKQREPEPLWQEQYPVAA